jgi:hypothetical protein
VSIELELLNTLKEILNIHLNNAADGGDIALTLSQLMELLESTTTFKTPDNSSASRLDFDG